MKIIYYIVKNLNLNKSENDLLYWIKTIIHRKMYYKIKNLFNSIG